MSLFKQVLLVIVIIFTILFVIVGGVTFGILQKSAKESLLENVQNSAINISLSITNAGVDKSSIKTVIGASFDNGNYEKILFRDIDGVVAYEVSKDTFKDKNIPFSFIRFMNIYDMGELRASSNVSNGWNNLGVLEVYANKTTYYEQMYAIFREIVLYASIGFTALFLTLFVLFKFMLAPLKRVSAQAKAVMNNEFMVVKSLPFTHEFRSVTISINSMVEKFEAIFKNTSELLRTNRELQYIDETTKLHNRKYFTLKMSEYLAKESLNGNGLFVVLNLKIDLINKTHGYVKTNDALLKLATTLKESLEIGSNIISRLNGSEIIVLCPNISLDELKIKAKKIFDQLQDIEQLQDSIYIGVGRYENERNLKEFFIKVDFVSGQSKILGTQECYYINDYKKHKTKDEWILIVNKALKNDGFKFSFKDVISAKTKDIIHSQIFIDIGTQDYSYAEFMASIRRLGRLDEVYMFIIKKVLQMQYKHILSLKLPRELIENLNNYTLLEELLSTYKDSRLIFELEEIAINNNQANAKMFIELFKKFGFSYAIYNFIADTKEYQYIKEHRPIYIKSPFEFLSSSTQSLSMIKMLSTSLGLKLIVVCTNEVALESIQELEVDAFLL